MVRLWEHPTEQAEQPIITMRMVHLLEGPLRWEIRPTITLQMVRRQGLLPEWVTLPIITTRMVRRLERLQRLADSFWIAYGDVASSKSRTAYRPYSFSPPSERHLCEP